MIFVVRIVLAFLLCVFFIEPYSVFAAVPASLARPTLLARKSTSGKIALTWTIKKQFLQRRPVVEMGRRFSAERSFVVFGRYQRPKTKQTVFDQPGSVGVYFYRARIINTQGRSQWSKSARVVFTPKAVATPTPIVTPIPPNPSTPTPAPTPGSPLIPTPTSQPLTTPPSPPLLGNESNCPAGTEEEVAAIVNEERQSAGLSPLSIHPQLMWSSRAHNINMTYSGNLTHDGWYDYIVQSGFTGGLAGENIAYGQTTATSVMIAWMASIGHRENILLPAFRYIGVSCLQDGDYRKWWVQNFG